MPLEKTSEWDDDALKNDTQEWMECNANITQEEMQFNTTKGQTGCRWNR